MLATEVSNNFNTISQKLTNWNAAIANYFTSQSIKIRLMDY